MASKTITTEERIGRVGRRRQVVIPRELFEHLNMREGDFVAFSRQDNGVLVKPKRLVDPDDTLTAEEEAIVKKAERGMRQGRFVPLDQLRHELDRPRPKRSRKTA